MDMDANLIQKATEQARKVNRVDERLEGYIRDQIESLPEPAKLDLLESMDPSRVWRPGRGGRLTKCGRCRSEEKLYAQPV